MKVDDALRLAKAETVAFGIAFREYEAGIEVFRMATSEAERAELRPMIVELRKRVVAADIRSRVAVATLENVENEIN